MHPLSLGVIGLRHRHAGATRDTPNEVSFRLAPGEKGLLLLDEPIAALDGAARSRLGDVLASLPTTMLLATHEPEYWLVARGDWRPVVVLGDLASPA